MLHFVRNKRQQTFCTNLKDAKSRAPVDRPECLRVPVAELVCKRFLASSRY